ncbi:MAG TPA: Ig-like domain-containing protein [Longimicrobium sp.]|jgi:alpha-tubulin suppressor-like RCC1 family protein
MRFKHCCPLALLGAGLLGACTDDVTGTGGANPAPEAPRALGLVEIRISGIGTAQMSAAVFPLERARGDLTPVPGGSPAGTVQVRHVSAATVDVGTRGAGGQRYLQAVFQVRNADAQGTAYATQRRNVAFVPVSTAGTIPGTPVRRFLRQDGGAADSALAAQLRPTGAVALDAGGAPASQYPDVLQAFTEAEADAIGMPEGVTNRFPYGFVVRHATATDTRTLAPTPAADQFDGRVTFAYRIPLAATAADDPFTISVLAVAVEDGETRVTQAPEEQAAAGRSAFEARAAALAATGVTLFPGGAYAGSAAKRMLCGVRTAGESGNPAATLSPCPAIASVAVSPTDAVRLVNVASELVGQTVQLTAAATDANGGPAEWASIAWSSSDSAVATVSGTGLVTITGAGRATITAAAGGKSGTATLAGEPLRAATLTTGTSHACGLTPSGAAYCWGANYRGQLGDGTTTDRGSPVAVAGGHTFTSISAGFAFTVALTSSGVAYAWGGNDEGALGDGTTTNRAEPVAVSGGLTFASISAGGFHVVGLTSTGAAYAWGRNQQGQLGDGTDTLRTAPVAVTGGLSFARVEGGFFHTVALTSTGAVYQWGGSGIASAAPMVVPTGGRPFVSVSTSAYHTVALAASGKAYAWGSNSVGQLGDGTTTNSAAPVAVSGELTFASITAGRDYTLALTRAGAAYAWGGNVRGSLGDGTTTDRTAPVAVSGGLTFTSIGAGVFYTSIGVTSAGAAYGWGDYSGQSGGSPGTIYPAPVAISGGVVFKQP